MYQPAGDGSDATAPPAGSDPPVSQSALGGFFGDAAAAVAAAIGSGASGYSGSLDAPEDPMQSEVFRMDKQAIYEHPLMPLLNCLLEKCELATCSPRDSNDQSGTSVCSAASFKDDLAAFTKLNQSSQPYYRPNPELDNVMLLAIRVLRIHLLELEKVHELCDNFCQRYVTTIKEKIPDIAHLDDRATSTRPASSISSPANTAVSSASPAAGTPMPQMGGMYPQPGAYDNHMAPSADSTMSHNSSLHSSSLPTSQADPKDVRQAVEHPQQQQQQPQPPPPQAGSGAGSVKNEMTGMSGHDLSAGHSGHASSLPDNSGSYQQLSDSEYKPQIAGLDAGSDGGDESLSLCGSLAEDGGRDSVSSEGVGNGSDTPAAPGSIPASNGKRKVPKVFSKEAINKFRSWLFQNLSHPYPSEEQKRQLANDTGLTILQVNNWFINARRRIVQPMIDSNNRAGKSPHVNVFKNRRRKNSNGSPSPDSMSVPNSVPYSGAEAGPLIAPMNPAVAAATASMPYAPMFGNSYNPMPGYPGATAFPPQMFMPMHPYGQPSWMDLSGGNP